MNLRIPLPVVVLLLLLILFALTSPACASDQVVTDFGDNGGTNQLRAKLTALQNSGGGTLTFAGGTATIVLVNGVLPTITRNTIIDGDNRVTISGNHATHIFYVNGVLTLTNITITDGYYPIWPLGDGGAARNYGTLNINNSRFLRNQTTPDFSGGAIVTYGILNITNSEFGYNKGGNGGAIYLGSAAAVATIVGSNFHDNEATDPKNSHGGAILLSEGASMTVDSSRFNNNKASVGTGSQAVGGGGAVYMRADSTVTMTNTVLEGNLAAGVGGAIVNQGTLTLVNSNVSGNSATYLFGGGIDSAFGSNTFTNTIVSNNFASVQGGGISMFMGTANLTNVTFNGNSVGFGGQGAGLYNYSGTATLTNTTLSANSGTGRAGAIVNTGTISLVNTTVIGNEAPQIQHFNDAALATLKNTLIAQGGFSGNCFGAFTSLGGNLSDDDSCSFGAGRDHVNILLGPLANNGGFTETHLPLPGSIAIDNGIASGAPARDQRGYLRVGSAPDVGAAEFGGTIPVSLANISTRGIVETGNSALIGGFIIRGGGPKKMILRAIGPTLANFGITNPLTDPILELHDSAGALILTNDNWGQATNKQAIMDSGYAPPGSAESAILTSLIPGNYTAVVRGRNNDTGVALVEAYDLDNTSGSKFGNVSTRSFVGTGISVMIAGVIVKGPDSENLIIRGLGPTLGQAPFNVPNPLQNPMLDLRDANGNLISSNDNWDTATNKQSIVDTGLAPPTTAESAILTTLPPGNYTAILRGVNNTTGNALVEVYGLN